MYNNIQQLGSSSLTKKSNYSFDFSGKQKNKKVLNQKQESEKNREEITYHVYIFATEIQNLYFPYNKVHCDNCEKDITRQARILCIGCPNSIDVCMNCFLNLHEFAQHTIGHSYSIINKLNFPIFVDDWTAEEELLLLEGLEKKGFGNWQDIAEMLGNEKSQEEIAQHYDDIILSEKFRNMTLLSKRNQDTLELIKPKRYSHAPKRMKEEQSIMKGGRLTPNMASQSGQEIVGFMPKRGDFDIEFDNDAELLLAEMEFNDDDQPYEIEMKLKVLDIYNIRLDERLKRKNFVIDRDLLNLKKQNNYDKQRSKEEKELHNLMKPFSRFNKHEDHERFVQNLIKEKQLRAKIEELRFYRKLGIKTFEEVEEYLSNKRKKDEQYQKRQKQNEAFVYDSQKQRFLQRRTRFVPVMDGKDKNKQGPSFCEEEQQLCQKLGLSEQEYLILKEVLIRESVKNGMIKKDIALQKLQAGQRAYNRCF
ncbi:unnamed protein product (macronuclear) [Paramecium tetraurelia]|uniref:Transcriptional adapter n=1 Tax=Paramecium tetraurelia TaxID=5888 RepID=A0CDV4_PARTE|nr:uncharacterized protein GSPATT00007183001 [Paramecium tetraurelia]CAK68971.1 unnamed protein product [Paramecium tetraurelia]|eukprot:XP_001436368.1 hypothetical protein (macronuclear) [Paramecium tetraurelia strain d4-2]